MMSNKSSRICYGSNDIILCTGIQIMMYMFVIEIIRLPEGEILLLLFRKIMNIILI